MTEKLDPRQSYDFKELLIAEMIEIDSITQLLIKKASSPSKIVCPNSSMLSRNTKNESEAEDIC
jgi:hypothetical protein